MSNIVPTVVEKSSPSGREARLTRDRDGEPAGAAVWLNADDLDALGIDIETADAVAYRVDNGDFRVDTLRKSDK